MVGTVMGYKYLGTRGVEGGVSSSKQRGALLSTIFACCIR